MSGSNPHASASTSTGWDILHEYKILRIPAESDQRMRIVKVRTVGCTALKERTEYHLRHIPDVDKYWDYIPTAIGDRTVCQVDITGAGSVLNGRYYMLKNFVSETMGLNENEEWSGIGNRRAYGDAFIFKLNHIDLIDPPERIYTIADGRANIGDVSSDLVKTEMGRQIVRNIMTECAVSLGKRPGDAHIMPNEER